MSVSVRWAIAILIVVVAIVVALVLQLRDTPAASGPRLPGSGQPAPNADLPALRREADLPLCPPSETGVTPKAQQMLGGITVTCLADGGSVDPAGVVSGRIVVLNFWAYWCGPCAEELPAMAEYQRRVGDDLTVITVHQDPDEAAALSRLAEFGVRLPAWQDGDRRIAAALQVPNVMPATVVLRQDSSVAGTLPRAFTSADEIAAAVDQTMGAPQ